MIPQQALKAGGLPAKPFRTAIMTPAHEALGSRVAVDPVYLDDIPKAMDAMGWTVSAQLMRRWFSTKPAWAMSESWRRGEEVDYSTLTASQFDDQIVKMKWVLSFGRVLRSFEKCCDSYQSPAAITRLKDRWLTPKGWSPGGKLQIGEGAKTALELERSCQDNFERFGSLTDDFDDLFGALFKATFKVAVVGKASYLRFAKRDIFEIDKIGIYVRDTYDFNVGSWLEDDLYGLGIWSKKTLLSKSDTVKYRATPVASRSIIFPGFVPAENADFRNWQKIRNDGGDFFVFSDVIWLKPKVPYVYL